MRVLLINPSDLNTARMGRMGALFTPIPPLGIASIGGSLVEAGVDVDLLDQLGAQRSNESIAAFVAERRYDLVGISCLTAAMDSVVELCGRIRTTAPGAKLVLGNIHAAVFHRELVQDGTADFVIRGEGERSMVDLARALDGDGALDRVPGLTWLTDVGELCSTPRGADIDLDTLPDPAWHLLDLDRYRSTPLLGVRRSLLHIQASRGCGFRCTFCSQEVMNRGVRVRSVDSILGELERAHTRYGTEYFAFTDAFFPVDAAQGEAFAQAMIRSGLHRKVRWICETRVDRVNRSLLQLLRRAGLDLMMFGLESGDQAVLDGLGKRQKLEEARDAVRWARQAGIRTLGLYVLGLPGDTARTCRATARFARDVGTDMAKFNVAIPFPGSPMFEQWRVGIDPMPAWARFNSWYDPRLSGGELLYTPDGMTSAELIAIQRNAMLRFWARPRQVFKTLRSGAVSGPDLLRGAHALVEGYLPGQTR